MESASIAVVALNYMDFVQHVRTAFIKSFESTSFELPNQSRTAFVRFKNGNVSEYTLIDNPAEALNYKCYLFDKIEVPETVDLNDKDVSGLVNEIKTRSKIRAEQKAPENHSDKSKIKFLVNKLRDVEKQYRSLCFDFEKTTNKLGERSVELDELKYENDYLQSQNEHLKSCLASADKRFKSIERDLENAMNNLCNRGAELITLNAGMEKMASENERLQRKVEALEAAHSEGNLARLTKTRFDAENKLVALIEMVRSFEPKGDFGICRNQGCNQLG